jgi:hypothetical protein
MDPTKKDWLFVWKKSMIFRFEKNVQLSVLKKILPVSFEE